MLIELDPVDRITADAVGSPGARAFYLQARKDDRLVTLLVEKQQVQLLAASVVEILSRVGKETGQGPSEEQMGLDEPIVPQWRAGRLSIGYHDERDMLVLEAEELLPEDDEQDEDGEADQEGEEADQEGEEAAPGGAVLGLADIEGLRDLEGNGETGGAEGSVGGPEGAVGGPGVEGGEDHEDLSAEEELARLEGQDARRVRLWATREQMLSLARHGASVCAAGRPRCQLCGNPMDPEGHQCPALNGHRPSGAD